MGGYCLLFAPLITAVVAAVKRVPFIGKYPKLVSLAISSVLGAVAATHGSAPGIDWNAIAQCVGTVFAGSVATHEVVNTVTKPASGAAA